MLSRPHREDCGAKTSGFKETSDRGGDGEDDKGFVGDSGSELLVS